MDLIHLNSVLRLPHELIAKILKYTDYKTLVACRRTCHHLKGIVDASSELQYIIELAAAGMCDGMPNDATPAEQLRGLRGMQSAWKSSSWSLVDNFPYSKEISPYPVMVSGNLVVFWSSSGRRGELVLFRFPSESRGIPERLWYLEMSTNHFKAVGADDSQDLLVIVCSDTIYIRTLSTGDVHPLTSTSGSIQPPPIAGVKVHIYGDHLLILGDYPAYNGLVWNWKTGELVVKIPLTTSACFTFLDRRHILSVHNVIAGAGTRESEIFFQVMTLPDGAGGERAPSFVYRFMSNLSTRIPPFSTELYENTLPLYSSSQDHGRGRFHPDPDRRLLGLALVLGSPTAFELARLTQHMLVVPHDAFLSYIATHSQSRSPNPSPLTSFFDSNDTTTTLQIELVVVPWDTWSPGNTMLMMTQRGFPLGTGMYDLCGMHMLSKPEVIPDHAVLRIADYHPQRVARKRANAAQSDDGRREGDGYDGEGRRGEQWPDGDVPDAEPQEIPYVEKNIPLPEGVRPECVRCVLGEDAVFLIQAHAQVSVNGDESDGPANRIEKIYYHPI